MSRNQQKSRAENGTSLAGMLALLEFLDSDRHEAEKRYTLLRRKLVKFLELRNAAVPEDLADAALEQVALKLERGFKLRPGDPYPYFCGVAIMLLKAAARRRARELKVRNDWKYERQATHADQGEDRREQRLRCLDCCLKSLDEDKKRIILEYYVGQGKERMEARRRLAEKLGIPLNALRIRAWRIREALQKCVQARLDEEEP